MLCNVSPFCTRYVPATALGEAVNGAVVLIKIAIISADISAEPEQARIVIALLPALINRGLIVDIYRAVICGLAHLAPRKAVADLVRAARAVEARALPAPQIFSPGD